MTWNYRVIKTKQIIDKIEHITYAIHEVYYDENGQVESWTENPVYLASESVNELKQDLLYIKKAFALPVLNEEELTN